MKRLRLFFLATCTALAIASCEKDTPDNAEEFTDRRGEIWVSFDHKLGDDDFAFGQIFEDDFGRKVTITRASLYLGKCHLGSSQMEEYNLVKPEVEDYFLGKVEADGYATLTLRVGLEPAVNNANPAQYDPDHALYAPQSPSVHWDWNQGYLFVVLDGQYDSDGDSIPDSGFQYHCGTNPLVRDTTMVHSVDLPQRGKKIININLDWTGFLTNVDIAANPISHSGGTQGFAVAEQIVNNIHEVFSISQ